MDNTTLSGFPCMHTVKVQCMTDSIELVPVNSTTFTWNLTQEWTES